ncbi:stress-induced protein YchH [Pectobacteriaceae bacterium CE70]|nr:stress-induced protein YchH [Pectobacteriaceae bacterium C52]WJV64948.1 stress-induced protein YchH [Pectobacteriaceae bacterium CE70]WJY08968.1 stress-induced protein YchH [Pectobacteriaceae bacterium C80]
MKHKHSVAVGNIFMGLGMLLMILGIAYSIIGQLPKLDLPGLSNYVELIAIFVGAILWLVGARVSGREHVADRYWWVKHFDKRCRRQNH